MDHQRNNNKTSREHRKSKNASRHLIQTNIGERRVSTLTGTKARLENINITLIFSNTAAQNIYLKSTRLEKAKTEQTDNTRVHKPGALIYERH